MMNNMYEFVKQALTSDVIFLRQLTIRRNAGCSEQFTFNNIDICFTFFSNMFAIALRATEAKMLYIHDLLFFILMDNEVIAQLHDFVFIVGLPLASTPTNSHLSMC